MKHNILEFDQASKKQVITAGRNLEVVNINDV